MSLSENTIRYSQLGTSHAWRPGALRQFPVLGVIQLVGVVLGICAAITILIVSDQALISDWKYSPAVYLTISYTISNFLLAAAFAQGVTLTWWNKAIKEGTVLGDLHRYHAQGTAAWAALTAGKHFNFIAFATLFVTLTPINGPLLQRSSTVGSKSLPSQANLQIPITRSLRDGTGVVFGRAFKVALFSQPFKDVVQAYYGGESIVANSTGCPGDATCTGRLPGAGIAVNCSTASVVYNLSMEVIGADGKIQRNPNQTDVFVSTFSWDSFSPGNISLYLKFKDTSATAGELVVKKCSLQTATVEYPITIDGNSSTILLSANTSIFDDVVLSLNPYPTATTFGHISEVGGYAFALSTRFNANMNIAFAGAAGYDLASTGSVGPQFAGLDDVWSNPSWNASHVKITDPTIYLLNQARELMFRTALAQGNSSMIESVKSATQVRKASIYISHYDFLGIAVAISTMSLGVVLVTFHGYWHLGREVTFSPVEIAKAFSSPLLAEENSNSSAEEMVKSAGTKPVQIADPGQVKSLRG
ncbi:hypothetical protein CKM354_001135400 [Cercospora kikuchii]|uniref:Uncharacterized protein n=1 Tax=Cercospora kikuchii TaxID=84275 RepID=A0A9P3FI84_9PEZI|nr:uncharacterized protein CKM354_001135400 [Cercospora kikuchii]GIZ48286.1 hypothetical protein CKM354_001135400 [Cercospora kikuchii]